MASTNQLFCSLVLLLLLSSASAATTIFREYIGAEFNRVKLTDIPINPNIHHFDFILAFAIDYTTSSDNPSPTNGHFNIFWDTQYLNPASVAAVKNNNRNVRFALSLGGDSVGNGNALFSPTSVESWVNNAVSSLTSLIHQYNLDGIDIDYEHFSSDPNTFAECIGQLITTLKKNGVISFASIAPFDDETVQSHYMALWSKYGQAIDYVNFQFYAYDASTTVSQFIRYFNTQSENYDGSKLIASFATDSSSGGLGPSTGFFNACNALKAQGKLNGIFIWSADDSFQENNGFRYEQQSQSVLTA